MSAPPKTTIEGRQFWYQTPRGMPRYRHREDGPARVDPPGNAFPWAWCGWFRHNGLVRGMQRAGPPPIEPHLTSQTGGGW